MMRTSSGVAGRETGAVRQERSASAIRYAVIAAFALVGITLNLVSISDTLIRVLSASEVSVLP